MEQNQSGIFVPGLTAPAGYAKFTSLLSDTPMMIAVAFIVAVEIDPDIENGPTLIYTTTSEKAFAVAESFDDVITAIRESQQ